MKKLILALTATIPLLVPGQLLAEGHPGGPPRPLEKFQEADANNDGVISYAEMDRQRQDRFSRADVDADGFISFDEALSAHRERSGKEPGPKARAFGSRMFNAMDIDGDGLVSYEEMLVRSDRNFKDMDANLDGEVTLLEAKAAMFDKFTDRKGKRPGSRN